MAKFGMLHDIAVQTLLALEAGSEQFYSSDINHARIDSMYICD